MPQVIIYLTQELDKLVHEAAAANNMTKADFIMLVIKQQFITDSKEQQDG